MYTTVARIMLSIFAINLHSASTAPDTQAFAFPHFGSEQSIYTDPEISLWNAQTRLIHLINERYPAGLAIDGEGGRGFLEFAFPETWWWRIGAENSVALTLETTYGKAGFEHWTNENDIRNLGEAFVDAVYQFHDVN